MSNYNTLLNHIEYKLGNTLNSNSDLNFYETQIKKNLPYFQNQRIKNLEKEMSNGNNLYSTSYNLNSNFGNKSYGSGNLNIDTFDTKNRKSMEREMEPYLNKMKSELNFLMDNFRNEIGNCSNIQPQFNSLEEKIEDNKKMIDIFQEDNNKKISFLENRVNVLNLEVEKLNNKLTDMNKKVSEVHDIDYKIKEMTFQVNDIQTKTNNYDMTNADLYNKIQDQLLKIIENQSKNINDEIQNLKNRNEDFNKKVLDLENKYNNVYNMNLNIHNENKENKKDLSNFEIENSNLKILFTNGIKQIDSFRDNIDDLKNEINNYKSWNNKLNEEIAENQMHFKSIGENIKKEIKRINELNDKILNSNSQISILKDQIIQIDLSSKTQKDRLERFTTQNSDKFNEMQNNFTSSISNNKNELEQNFEIFKDEINGKIDSINNKIREFKYKKNSQNEPSIQTSNISDPQIKKFIPQQTQFNEIIEKTIEQYKKELDEVKEDVKNHEINFESIDQNFKSINEGIEQIRSLPESLTTLRNNQNTLRNDVQNGFNETTRWENEMNERINKTIEDLKKEINNNFREIQIQNSMNNANAIPSIRDLPAPNIRTNLSKLEEDVRNQEKVINDLKSTLANKVDLNRVNGRCDLIDKKMNNLENDINSIKSIIMTDIPNSYEERNINKKISFSERNNIINDNIQSSNIIDSNIIITDNKNNIINNNDNINKFQENLSSLRQSSIYNNDGTQESIYPHGYINNLIEGTKLDNSNLVSQHIEKININNNLKANQNYSSENDIEKYDNKPSNTDKYKKNELYKSNTEDLSVIDLGNNKYLKYYFICEEGANIEVNKHSQFDKNKINNNNIINDYNNEDFNKKSIEKDDYDIYLDNIIQQNKENNDNEYNNNFDNNNEDYNNENLAFVEKPSNVNGNDLDVDFDANEDL